MGCMAQLQGEAIRRRAPIVDLVFGSPAIARVGELVERAHRERTPIVETGEAPARQDHRAARRAPRASGPT